MADRSLVAVSHPEVEGVAWVPRTMLPHISGWSEVKDPDRAGKPTARRTAAAEVTATPTAATSTSLPTEPVPTESES